MKDYVVIIPARIGSTRLPNKPLIDIHGKPMILHTLDRAYEAVEKERVFIATDSKVISDVCTLAGANVIMTSDKCLTGTDRVAEVACKLPAKSYINLQGDEPMMDPSNILKVIEASQKSPNSIINAWAWIKSEAEFRSRSIPKVVIRRDGRLMYMSRAPIPGTKADTFTFSRKQVCVYGFPRESLVAFSQNNGKAEHENSEDIEILRFLEMGWEVEMIELSGNFRAVDTPEDLSYVTARLRN